MKKCLFFYLLLFICHNPVRSQESETRDLKGFFSLGLGATNSRLAYNLALNGRYKNAVAYLPFVRTFSSPQEVYWVTSIGLEGGYALGKKTMQGMVTTGLRYMDEVYMSKGISDPQITTYTGPGIPVSFHFCVFKKHVGIKTNYSAIFSSGGIFHELNISFALGLLR